MTDEILNNFTASAATLTKFDLPMEFHLDYLRQMLESHTDKSLNHGVLVSFSSMKQRSMDNASVRVLYRSKDAKPSYNFVRDIALQLLLDQISNQISILKNTIDCGFKALAAEPLPYKMFSWTREDFLNRRQAPNCLWIIVLEKSLPPECLDFKKFESDLENLQQFIELIFAAFQIESSKIKTHVKKFVEDTIAFENILETLVKTSETYRIIGSQGIDTVLAMNFYRRDSKDNAVRNSLEQQLAVSNVRFPIEQRYQKNYYETRTNQHQIKADIAEEKLQEQIEHVQNMVEKDKFRTNCVVDLLHQETERYRRRIAEISAKLDTDYEAINSEISYKLTTIEKIKDQRKFYVEQIERFKEELEQSRLRILFEQEVERNRLRKLAEWKKKAKKTKKKGKPKI